MTHTLKYTALIALLLTLFLSAGAHASVLPTNCTIDADCNDGNVCSGIEVCNAGVCQSGTPLTCDDQNACTTDSCGAALGCQHSIITCDDGNACTENICFAVGGCNYATPTVCDDSNSCTTNTCNPASGCVFTGNVSNPATTCNDNNACTAEFCNADGTCGSSPVPGTTRYVSFNGTDAGDCTNIAAPCRSVYYAQQQSCAGDTIGIVGDGTIIDPRTDVSYAFEGVELDFTGVPPTPGNSVTIQGAQCESPNVFEMAGICYSINSTMLDGTFEVMLTFNYLDANNDGLVDTTGQDENALALYYNNGSGWTQFDPNIPTTLHDTINNKITVLTTHFTDFALSSAVTVTGYDLTPDYALSGQSVQVLGLLFNNTGATNDWINRLYVTFSGTSTADVPYVEFYSDTNADGVFDAGDNRMGGSYTWSSGRAGFNVGVTGPNRWVYAGTTKWVFVIYNTTTSATAGDTIGGYIATGDLGLDASGDTISPINAGGLSILDSAAPETLGGSATPNPTKDNLTVTGSAMDDVGVASGKLCLDNPTTCDYNMTVSDGVPGGFYEGLTYVLDTVMLSEGLHTLFIKAVDMAGRIDSTPFALTSIMFDHSAPHTTINAVPSILTISTWIFNGSSTDLYTRVMSPGVTYQLDIDGWQLAAPIDGAWDELAEDYKFTLNGLAEGSHTLYVRASDEPGNVESPPAEVTFCVDTVWPIANAGGPYTVDEGATVYIDGTASYDPTENCGSLTYQWFIDGDIWVGLNVSEFGAAWGDNGTHIMTIQVTDAAGHSTNASATVTVLNVAPTVIASDVSGNEGSEVMFTADFTDPATTNDQPYSYIIYWGDGMATSGSAAYGVTISAGYTYADNGTYTITVNVTDNDGGTGSDTATASIANVAPSVLTVADNGLEGSSTNMSFTFSDPATTHDELFIYSIDWDDGSAAEIGVATYAQGLAGLNFTHVFADNDNYSVSVTVTDNDGGVGSSADNSEILNVAPTATVLAPNGGEQWNGMRAINWTFSDPGADTFTCEVRLTNTTFNTGVTVVSPCNEGDNSISFGTHLFSDGTLWRATVDVLDDDGGNGFDVSDNYFTIDNTPPVTTLTLGMPNYNDSGTIYVNSTTPFTLSAVDNIVGVQGTIYSVDAGGLAMYNSPLTAKTMYGGPLSEGTHTLHFYSVDNLGNHEAVQNFTFIVDDSVPDADLAIGDPKLLVPDGDGELLYVTNTTPFNVTGVDFPQLNSSVQYCEYGVDTSAWTTASEFTLAGVLDGVHTVYYRCTDNLDQTGATKSQVVTVDSTGPVTTKLISEPRYPDGAIRLLIYNANTASPEGAYCKGDYGAFAYNYLAANGVNVTFWCNDNIINASVLANYDVFYLGRARSSYAGPTYVDSSDLAAWVANGGGAILESSGDSYEPGTTTDIWPGINDVFGYNNCDSRGTSDNAGGGPLTKLIDHPIWAGVTGNVGDDYGLYDDDLHDSCIGTGVKIGDAAYEDQNPMVNEYGLGRTYTGPLVNYDVNDDSRRYLLNIITWVAQHSAGSGSNDEVYVNSSTQFTMTAVDSSVGFNATYYRIDGGAWNLYGGAFSLPGALYAETDHIIEFYSQDLLGNNELTQEETDYLDNSVPDTTLTLGSPSVYSTTRLATWINSSTDLSLSALDYPLPSPPGYPSGIQTIYYDLDDDGTSTYSTPLYIPTEGNHTMAYWSIDNLDQVEESSVNDTIVDNTPPVIQSFYATNPAFSPDGNGVKDNTTFVFNATDNLATWVNELEYWIYIRDSSNSIVRSQHTLTTSGEGEQMLWTGDGLPDGTYTVQLIVHDPIGYEATQTINVVIDTIDPVLGSIFVGQTWIRVGTPFYMEAVASDNNGFDGDDCAITVIDPLLAESFAGYTNHSLAHGRCRGYATLTEELENGFGSLDIVLEDAAGNQVFGTYSPLGIDTVVNGPLLTVLLDEHIVTPGQLIGFNVSVSPDDMSGLDGFCYIRIGNLGWAQYTLSGDGVCAGEYQVPVGYPTGTTQFEAGLKDNVGNWETTDNTTILQIDGFGPFQHRIQPLEGQYYSAVLPVELDVTDTPAGVNDSSVIARIYHKESLLFFGEVDVEDRAPIILTRTPNTTLYLTSFDIANLSEGTMYYLSYKSADMIGNVNDTDWHSFPFGIDHGAPVWPAGAALTVTSAPYDIDGSVMISWPAATDAKSDISAYRIYINGVYDGTNSSPALFESFIGLPDGVYSFTVEPVDGAGNSGTNITGMTTVDRGCAVDVTCFAQTSGGGHGGGGSHFVPLLQTPPAQQLQEPAAQPVDTQETGDRVQPQSAPTQETDNGNAVQQEPANDGALDNLATGAVIGGGIGSMLWLWILLGLIVLAGVLVLVLRRKK